MPRLVLFGDYRLRCHVLSTLAGLRLGLSPPPGMALNLHPRKRIGVS